MKKTHDQLDSRWPRCRPALEGLPQAAGEVWQVDVRRFPAWILERGAPERPWLAARSDVPVQLESAAFEPRRYYGVVMGQAGLTYGLALYDDLGGLRDLLERPGSDEENARRTSAIALTFSAAHEISPADLHAIECNSWEIAGPNAYLLVTRVRREQEPTLPSKLDLIVLERALIGLPEFLRSPCGPRLRFELRFLEPLEPLVMSWA